MVSIESKIKVCIYVHMCMNNMHVDNIYFIDHFLYPLSYSYYHVDMFEKSCLC